MHIKVWRVVVKNPGTLKTCNSLAHMFSLCANFSFYLVVNSSFFLYFDHFKGQMIEMTEQILSNEIVISSGVVLKKKKPNRTAISWLEHTVSSFTHGASSSQFCCCCYYFLPSVDCAHTNSTAAALLVIVEHAGVTFAPFPSSSSTLPNSQTHDEFLK